MPSNEASKDFGGFSTGDQIAGRYALVSFLASGGMGCVWVAEHTTLHSKVAIKFDLTGAASLSGRFIREARIAAALNCPHLVRVFDTGVTESGVSFLIMEMLEGETLAELLTACAPLPFEQTVKIVSQIAQGLGSLHRAGITHRDLKPSNVFLQRGVGAKILDFGIARTEGSDETATATFMGTRRYASPEQAEDSSSAEPRSDLFSLGLITYECLLGASPYEGSSAGQIAELREKLPTPSTRGTVPPGFDDWFHRATHPDVDQRFEDAEQLTRALRQAFAENPGSRPPGKLAMAQVGDADTESVNDAPLVSESAPGSSSRRLRGGLVVAAIIALGLVFFIVFDGQTPPSRSQSTQTSRATDARATDARASDAQAADGVGSDAHSLGPPAARNLSKEESSAVVLAGPSDDTAVASKSLPLEKKSRSAAQSPSAAKKALNRPPQSAPEPDFSAKRTSGTEDASSQSDPFELRK